MLVQALSNTKDKGGRTGMALYNNKGQFIASYAMPTEGGGDGYGYDLAVNPKKNVLLTSSFTGYANYMRPLGELIKDGEAMKKFGNTMVLWDLKAMKPKKMFSVPGAPLEIRWSLNPKDDWAITATALTSKLWLVKQDGKGEWNAKEVGTIGDPSKIPLPVDISITRDGKGLWVNTFMDGKTRYFDLANPEAPKQTYEKGHRQASQHGLAELGRQALVHHLVAARQLGQGRRGQRAVPARLCVGRQGAHAKVRDRFHQGKARPRPPHEARLEGAAGRMSAAENSRYAALALARGTSWRAARRAVACAHPLEPLPALDFVPPAPGSYILHRIMPAPDGRVLGIDGRSQPLSRYTRGQVTLLGFIYTTCIDPEGCPLAYRVFDALKTAIAATPALHGKVRFVTLSFDPARDTPDVMRRYAGSRAVDASGGLRWYFLTTRSARELMPLVEGFGQDVRVTYDRSSGRARRELSHVLKVFLIDRAGDVREIYSSLFLHPQSVLNDIETLLMERDRDLRQR